MCPENPLQILGEANPDPEKAARAAAQIASLSEHRGEAGGLGMAMYGDDAPRTPVFSRIDNTKHSPDDTLTNPNKIEPTYNL